MKHSNTALRLKEIMNERNLKQTDILQLTIPYCEKYGVKMNKSDLSQYCSGKVEPNQNKLFVLSAALGVNEAWLMGFDVPMSKNSFDLYQESLDEAKAFKAVLSSLGWKYESVNSEIGTKFIFSNGATSFEVSADDYSTFLDDMQTFMRKRLYKLMLRSTNALFGNAMPNAAHGRTDTEITNDMIKYDEDIMDADDF